MAEAAAVFLVVAMVSAAAAGQSAAVADERLWLFVEVFSGVAAVVVGLGIADFAWLELASIFLFSSLCSAPIVEGVA